MAQPLFVFMQLEFPWSLGPADGRYLLRAATDGDPQHVVVLNTLAVQGARARGRAGAGGLLAGRARRAPVLAPEPEPAAAPTTRVTVIDPVSLSAESQARAWLSELDRDREIGAAVMVVNRVLYSHRIACADPDVHEVSAVHALVIRAGWGEGEQVADGRWAHARALPVPADTGGATGARRGLRRDRSSALRPQERLAGLLGARGAALLCEETALRARADLDHGRVALAALELDRAFAFALSELPAERRQDLAVRIAELEQLRAGVKAQAQAALGAPDGELDREALTHALERLRATLRARTATGV
ncbi:MAG TPA: hypothetical protein VK272_03970 [Solirubrobacteraceae bacterium]|nr:hypothetical protein [Solirubrobacteraceae bacterium]